MLRFPSTLLLAACAVASTFAFPTPVHHAGVDILANAGGPFSLPYTGPAGADEALVFNLGVTHRPDAQVADINLNGQPLNLTSLAPGSHIRPELDLYDLSPVPHQLHLTLDADLPAPLEQAPELSQGLHIRVNSVDGLDIRPVGFSVLLRPTTRRHNLAIVLDEITDTDEVSAGLEVGQDTASHGNRMHFSDDDEVSFDLADEAESLALLEVEAESLRRQIITKKHAIAAYLKEHREDIPLQHLLAECDGLLCTAKVVAQRLCDRVGIVTEPSHGYASLSISHSEDLIDFHDSEKPPQTARNCTKSKAPTPGRYVQASRVGAAQPLNVPLLVTKNGSTGTHQYLDQVVPPNPLVRALEALAAVIGLLALFRVIRRKCMSMRTRVERAADREERRNARAYRRAARRASMRRRWDNLVAAVSCFGTSQQEPRLEDYEEKRALILQDAFLEQLEDVEQAEKGEIMEAEIRELRHAHEIVASLVRVGENRYDIVRPVQDLPPSTTPLLTSYVPTPATRSRTSTHTLPSYTSESLPDYSSTPENETETETLVGSGSSVADGFTNYTPTSDPANVTTGRCMSHSITSVDAESVPCCTRMARLTPTSSIVDVSTRASEDTIFTRPSYSSVDV